MAVIETAVYLDSYLLGRNGMYDVSLGYQVNRQLYPFQCRRDLKKHNRDLKHLVQQMEWAIQRINHLSVSEEDFIND